MGNWRKNGHLVLESPNLEKIEDFEQKKTNNIFFLLNSTFILKSLLFSGKAFSGQNKRQKKYFASRYRPD